MACSVLFVHNKQKGEIQNNMNHLLDRHLMKQEVSKVRDVLGTQKPGVFSTDAPPPIWPPCACDPPSRCALSCMMLSWIVPSGRVVASVLGQYSLRNCIMGIFRMWLGYLDCCKVSCPVMLAIWPSLRARMAAALDSTAQTSSQHTHALEPDSRMVNHNHSAAQNKGVPSKFVKP